MNTFRQSIAKISRYSLCTVIFSICLMFAAASNSFAQDDEIESRVRRLSETETSRLRAVIASPAPRGALNSTLREHFLEKEIAARTLGDQRTQIAILREAIKSLPDAYLRNNLANQLATIGEYDESEQFYDQSIATEADIGERSLTQSNRIYMLYQSRDWTRLRNEAPLLQQQLQQTLRTLTYPLQRFTVLRAQSRIAQALSLQHENLGQHQQSIAQAEEAAKFSQLASDIVKNDTSAMRRQFALATHGGSMRRVVSANRVAGRLAEAEAALAQHYNFSLQNPLNTTSQAVIFRLASELRFSQRDFVNAYKYSEQALKLTGSAQMPRSAEIPYQVNRLRALIGQQRFSEAARLLDEFDALAKEQPQLAPRLLYRLERGLNAVALKQWPTAMRALESGHKSYATRYGNDHPTTVATAGLLGVALWYQQQASQKSRAIELMTAAVQSYLSSTELHRFENQGFQPAIRRIVFEAYLQASTAQGGEQAMLALAAADGLVASATQAALGDAAVRAATSSPELHQLVRQEQDIRNEAIALRRYLSGEMGGQAPSLPQVATTMRERLAVLEQERKRLISAIGRSFPDYDKLVRPAPLSVAQLGAYLKPHQAMIVLHPTAQSVYVWVVKQAGAGTFHQASINETDLAARIQRLRGSLQFGASDKPLRAFDSQGSASLYTELLQPLQQHLDNKSEYIIAASGALAQIPFGLLITDATANSVAGSPWLIQKAALTHVPSASAWLQLQSTPRTQTAKEPLIAWGDPAFDSARKTGAKPEPIRQVSVTRQSSGGELGAVAASIDYARIPPLPETRDELLAIAATLSADVRQDVILSEKATRESVLDASKQGVLAKKRVVAFATHGLMAGDLPGLNQPALAMAADGREKQNPLAPLLTLEDVLSLKLNADWVVLSACNTASTDGRSDEALSGLARGFFYAGSRSLLVTHWAVESESATHLTTATFEHYVRNQTEAKSNSLRQAMLKVMAMPQYAHPAFWAPYVLVGDGGR